MRVTQGLVRAAAVAPRATGAIEGDRRLGWADLASRIASLAGGLRALGAVEGTRVAVLAHNSIAFFEAWFAVPWAGAALVPLNTRLALPELAFQLKDAGVELLLHGGEFADTAAALRAQGAVSALVGLDVPQADGGVPLSSLIERAQAAAEARSDGEALAGIFYTGGTTGLPKGVMLSHRALRAMAGNLMMHIPFCQGDVLFHAAPMFHLADIGTLFGTMAAGTHVFRRTFAVEAMLRDFAAHGVTHCFTVPTVIERAVASPLVDELDLSALRFLGYGGAPMPAASVAAARARFPDVALIQGYGQTEYPAATFLSPAAHGDEALLRSCGQPCYGYDMRVVDEHGREVPRGTVGEIVGRGDNAMSGYWNRPEETADVLRDGWVHTRDAGRMDADGYLFITDRLKDMIVSGAENVYSIEVENALSWHPAVAEAAVIGLPDPHWGERVHAIVVLREGEQADAAALAAACRERIAGYKVPKSFEILDAPLPRSAAGKILKAQLRDARVTA